MFQFHCGTIKTVVVALLYICMYGFNSTVVRLKQAALKGLSNIIIVFQFHCGTIKTFFAKKSKTKSQRFQFHCGTIKTQTARGYIQNTLSFNSTVVRLKLL